MSTPILLTEAVITEFYMFTSLVLLAKFYSRPSIKFRCPDLLILQTLASACIIFIQIMWLHFRRGNVCILVRAATSTISPMIPFSITIRIMQIAAKYYSGINAEKKMHQKEHLSARTLASSAVGTICEDDIYLMANINEEQRSQIASGESRPQHRNFLFRKVKALSQYMGNILAKRKRFFNTGNTLIAIITVVCLGTTCFLLNEILSDPYPDSKYCLTFSWFGMVFNVLNIALLFLLHPVIFYGNDTYGIRIELYCICFGLLSGFASALILRLAVIKDVPVRFAAMSSIWGNLSLHWISAGTPLLEAVLGEYHSRKSPRNRSQLQLASMIGEESYVATDWGSFQEMLKEPESLAEFTLFAVREFSVENLLFYRRVELLKRIAERPHLFPDNNKFKRMMDREIMSIYREFIVEGSELELNINDTTRSQIEEAVINNQLSIEVFNDAYQEILMLIFQNTFPRYLQEKV